MAKKTRGTASKMRRGLKVRLRRDSEYWGQSDNQVGTVLSMNEKGRGPGQDWWDVRWGGNAGENCYHPRDLDIAGKAVAATVLTPREFAKERELCDEWAPYFRKGTWEQVWNKLIHEHGKLGEMCDWLQEQEWYEGDCLCGEPWPKWKVALEKGLSVKLGDRRRVRK